MRRSWFEEATNEGPFAISVERLESWQRAMADGIIEPHELEEQKVRVLELLRALEPTLDDAQHEQVTRVLEELTVLQAMHGTLLVDEFAGGALSRRADLPDADLDVEGA